MNQKFDNTDKTYFFSRRVLFQMILILFICCICGGMVIWIMTSSQKFSDKQLEYKETASQHFEQRLGSADAMIVFNGDHGEEIMIFHYPDGSWTCASKPEETDNSVRLKCFTVSGPGILDVFYRQTHVAKVYYQDGKIAADLVDGGYWSSPFEMVR